MTTRRPHDAFATTRKTYSYLIGEVPCIKPQAKQSPVKSRIPHLDKIPAQPTRSSRKKIEDTATGTISIEPQLFLDELCIRLNPEPPEQSRGTETLRTCIKGQSGDQIKQSDSQSVADGNKQKKVRFSRDVAEDFQTKKQSK